jgi:hypothetical protein
LIGVCSLRESDITGSSSLVFSSLIPLSRFHAGGVPAGPSPWRERRKT